MVLVFEYKLHPLVVDHIKSSVLWKAWRVYTGADPEQTVKTRFAHPSFMMSTSTKYTIGYQPPSQ